MASAKKLTAFALIVAFILFVYNMIRKEVVIGFDD
jgi:hypothetical protein